MMRNGMSGRNIIDRLKNFFKALYFHVGRGMPKSSQFLIDSRYIICQDCDSFHEGQCLECGCNVSRKKVFLNKLAWRDQKCPLDRWDAQ